MKRVHLYISGRVQGVLFRDTMKRKANKLGLKGWVKNLTDNRVEAIIEGENIQALLEWAKKGPLLSKVDNIDLEWENYQGEFNEFKIKRPR